MNKTHYKIFDEVTGDIETFETLHEVETFLKQEKMELPITYELEVEDMDDSFYDEEWIYQINLINRENSKITSEYFIYKHVRNNEIYFTYTKDFWNGSKHYNTVDECLVGWLYAEQESNDDEEPSCYSCGDGGCIHCRPSWFL